MSTLGCAQTHTIAQLLLLLVCQQLRTKTSDDEGKAVLVTAGTNTAADNILRKLRDANAALPKETRPLSAGQMLRVSATSTINLDHSILCLCMKTSSSSSKKLGGMIKSVLFPLVSQCP